MAVRGVRGAITVDHDLPKEIVAATRELLEEILKQNQIETFDDIASIFFTTTPDLVSTFPAEAARAIGMSQVPLLCASEIAVVNKMPKCIRVLMHLNTEKRQCEIQHIYLREAKKLRPDVSSAQ